MALNLQDSTLFDHR